MAKRGELHHNAKLKPEQVMAIHANRRSRGPWLAKKYGVSNVMIFKIRRGRAWKHITEGAA